MFAEKTPLMSVANANMSSEDKWKILNRTWSYYTPCWYDEKEEFLYLLFS